MRRQDRADLVREVVEALEHLMINDVTVQVNGRSLAIYDLEEGDEDGKPEALFEEKHPAPGTLEDYSAARKEAEEAVQDAIAAHAALVSRHVELAASAAMRITGARELNPDPAIASRMEALLRQEIRDVAAKAVETIPTPRTFR